VSSQHLPAGKRLFPLRLSQTRQPGVRIISASRHMGSIPVPGRVLCEWSPFRNQ